VWGGHSVAFWLLAALGTVNIIYGAVCAMAQTDLKKLVAYSSISHMGYVMLGMAAFTPQGINGAVLQMFNHGTITAMLFLLVGVVYDRAHHREITASAVSPRSCRSTPGSPASPSSPPWGSRGCRPSSPRCWCCSARGPCIRRSRWSRRARSSSPRLSPLDAAAHVPRAAQREVPDAPEITARELFTLAPLAAIVVFLGIYPAPILNLQSPALLRLNEQVRSSTPTRPSGEMVAAGDKQTETR
jgi:NADH-quinone oxidoreductase subunit M